MPSSAAFHLMTLPVLALFMIFLTACGSLTKTTTSIRLSIKRRNRKKVKNVVIKLHATRIALPQNFFLLCSASTFQTIIPFALSSGCTRPSSLMYPSVRKGLINPRQLSLAGDGTPLETARLERSKRICNCWEGSD